MTTLSEQFVIKDASQLSYLIDKKDRYNWRYYFFVKETPLLMDKTKCEETLAEICDDPELMRFRCLRIEPWRGSFWEKAR